MQRLRDLEKQIADLEAWESEKKRYSLQEFGAGAFAYAVQSENRLCTGYGLAAANAIVKAFCKIEARLHCPVYAIPGALCVTGVETSSGARPLRGRACPCEACLRGITLPSAWL